MLAFSHWRKRKISAPLGAFTLMWLLLLIAYLGVHCMLGSRYIAWKFASYYPLMISFALPALAIYIVQSR
jgi:hypothetical protein